MSDSLHDENGRSSIICASKDDGTTIVQITADPTTHGVSVDDNTTGDDNGNNNDNAMIDGNSVAVWFALSSAGDGSLVEVYADPATGKLLIDSN